MRLVKPLKELWTLWLSEYGGGSKKYLPKSFDTLCRFSDITLRKSGYTQGAQGGVRFEIILMITR